MMIVRTVITDTHTQTTGHTESTCVSTLLLPHTTLPCLATWSGLKGTGVATHAQRITTTTMAEQVVSSTANHARTMSTSITQHAIEVLVTAIHAYEKMSMTVMIVARRYGVVTTTTVNNQRVRLSFTVTDTSPTLSSLARAHTTWALS